jgi:hypothetical protein
MKYLAAIALLFSANAFAAQYDCAFTDLTEYKVLKEGPVDTDAGGSLSLLDIEKDISISCESLRNNAKARTELICGISRASHADLFEFPTAAAPAGAEALNLTASVDGKPFVVTCDLR